MRLSDSAAYRGYVLAGALLLLVTGIAGTAAAQSMVLDPDQDPVASFPGNIDLQGNSILDCDTINGVDCDSLGSGGGGSGDADYSEVVNRSGDNMTGDLLMDNAAIRFTDSLTIGDGNTIGTDNDDIAIGNNAYASGSAAVAIGENAVASGTHTTAVGRNTAVTDNHGTALGRGSQATGHGAVALGEYAVASGAQALAVGWQGNAPNDFEATFGNLNGDEMDLNVTGQATVHDHVHMPNGVAIGNGATAAGIDTTAVGDQAAATSSGAVALGEDTTAAGTDSVALGEDASASATGAVAIGNEADGLNSYEATFGNLRGEELDVNVTGDLTVHQDMAVHGSKNFVHPVNATHEAVYAAQESPEVRAVVEGVATVRNGSTVVDLPNHFASVVSDTQPALTVQVTPHTADTYGIAVTEKAADRIVVEELADGAGTFSFDYRVTGVRDGFEDHAPLREQ